MSDTLTEQEIVQQCLKGDNKAQELLFQTFSNKMFAVCLRYTSTREDAEDILQMGFIKIFKNLSKFEFKGSFEGWMRKIFVNTAIEHYRKNVKWMYAEDAQEVNIANAEISILEKLKAEDLLKLVQNLPVGYRTVFNLFVVSTSLTFNFCCFFFFHDLYYIDNNITSNNFSKVIIIL